MTTTSENNVAAQAGDESMRAIPVKRTANGFVVHHRLETLVREYGTLDLRSQRRRDCMAEIYEIAAAQVSPRATADVERDAARYRWLRERPYSDWKRIAFNTMDDHPFAIRCRDEEIDAAIATTKPGA